MDREDGFDDEEAAAGAAAPLPPPCCSDGVGGGDAPVASTSSPSAASLPRFASFSGRPPLSRPSQNGGGGGGGSCRGGVSFDPSLSSRSGSAAATEPPAAAALEESHHHPQQQQQQWFRGERGIPGLAPLPRLVVPRSTDGGGEGGALGSGNDNTGRRVSVSLRATSASCEAETGGGSWHGGGTYLGAFASSSATAAAAAAAGNDDGARSGSGGSTSRNNSGGHRSATTTSPGNKYGLAISPMTGAPFSAGLWFPPAASFSGLGEEDERGKKKAATALTAVAFPRRRSSGTGAPPSAAASSSWCCWKGGNGRVAAGIGNVEEEEEEEEEGDEEQRRHASQGTQQLDLRRRRQPQNEQRRRHRPFLAAPLILSTEVASNLAYYSISVNLVIYLSRMLGHEPASAAATAHLWTVSFEEVFLLFRGRGVFQKSKRKNSHCRFPLLSQKQQGLQYISPLIGGALADCASIGRPLTILVSSAIFTAGLVLLTVQAALLGRASFLSPSSSSLPLSQSQPLPSSQQQLQRHKVLFTLSMVALSLGTGGIKPNVSPCGKKIVFLK